MSHTPGPFRVAKHDSLKDVYHVDAGPQGYERTTVAILSGKQSKENAHLIAAAPELLQIAKAYRNLLKTMAHTDGEVATYHHINDIITKAEKGS